MSEIKDVYVQKFDNNKRTSWHTDIRQRKLDKERASETNNFVALNFLKSRYNTAYVIIDNRRYYLNWRNSFVTEGDTNSGYTDWSDNYTYVGDTVALVDIDVLEAGKSYPVYHKNLPTAMEFKNFDELRNLAQAEYDKFNKLPQIKQRRHWYQDKEETIDGYDCFINTGSKDEDLKPLARENSHQRPEIKVGSYAKDGSLITYWSSVSEADYEALKENGAIIDGVADNSDDDLNLSFGDKLKIMNKSNKLVATINRA